MIERGMIGGGRPNRRHLLLQLRIVVPFVLLALIWGSFWFILTDPLAGAPQGWSMAYRFVLATAVLFAIVFVGQRRPGRSLRAGQWRQGFTMTFAGHLVAMGIGISQFCLTFNLIYWAELSLTPGVIAVLFGLLMVPNALLALVFVGQAITRRFLLGSLIAIIGIGLLLVRESHEDMPVGQVGIGVLLTFLAILATAIGSVLQATETARRRPLMLMLAWAALWAALASIALAWTFDGPPVLPGNMRYWAHVTYLVLIGSVVAFPLYFQLIRDIGPARIGYVTVLVPIVGIAQSAWLDGYSWSTLAFMGAGLIIIGMIVALGGQGVSVSRGRL